MAGSQTCRAKGEADTHHTTLALLGSFSRCRRDVVVRNWRAAGRQVELVVAGRLLIAHLNVFRFLFIYPFFRYTVVVAVVLLLLLVLVLLLFFFCFICVLVVLMVTGTGPSRSTPANSPALRQRKAKFRSGAWVFLPLFGRAVKDSNAGGAFRRLGGHRGT